MIDTVSMCRHTTSGEFVTMLHKYDADCDGAFCKLYAYKAHGKTSFQLQQVVCG